ncbi:Gfo/Idh/MocA family protein [Palleronia abyssalis]|uniref:Glucose--fructose oxidoreductase n=1 Tax=Palleronia abyssalis TaxID=1501240 RepID=A0A2R8C182_9RHOB|nr:Gfo/Idh/MocA family oxidoreductase [Palleronia abyssalis]SPJ26175.1 Glucose--fructose oxidoreductase [Palleronia abyssalis]
MIRVAIIGTGIGREHLAGYDTLPDRFTVTTLCDLDLDRARGVAGDRPIAVTDDLDAVLDDEAIDLIDVCLPPHLHVPTATRALQAGKHVVCEKPLALSLAECDALIGAAAIADRRVFPVFQYRYGIAMAQIRALKAANLAGRPFAASVETHWNRGPDYYANPWRGTWKGEAGGAVLSHAIHNHDLLCTIFGNATAISASTATRVNGIETEDCAAILIEHDTGALSTSSITLGAATDTTRMQFTFQGFTATSGSAPYAPVSTPWSFTARDPYTQADIDAVLADLDTPRAGFAGFFHAIADALEGDAGREVTLQDGRQSIELVTAAYHSARTGQRVSLPLTEAAPLYRSWLPDLAAAP